MHAIFDLSWEGPVLSWRTDGVEHRVRLEGEIDHALALRSGGMGVVVGPRAVILHGDGELKIQLKNPFGPELGVGFYYFIYEGDDLVVVLAGASGDHKCVVNELTGELSAPRETR